MLLVNLLLTTIDELDFLAKVTNFDTFTCDAQNIAQLEYRNNADSAGPSSMPAASPPPVAMVGETSGTVLGLDSHPDPKFYPKYFTPPYATRIDKGKYPVGEHPQPEFTHQKPNSEIFDHSPQLSLTNMVLIENENTRKRKHPSVGLMAPSGTRVKFETLSEYELHQIDRAIAEQLALDFGETSTAREAIKDYNDTFFDMFKADPDYDSPGNLHINVDSDSDTDMSTINYDAMDYMSETTIEDSSDEDYDPKNE